MSTRLDLSRLTLMDALDLASLIEVEAQQRYVLFSHQLGRGGGYNPGTFFALMAENEAKHGHALAERRKALFGDKPARVTLDDLFDIEAPDVGAPRRTMSTIDAFQIALAAEQKAHDFYAWALPSITDPQVRTLFAELRDEEIEHVRMLQEALATMPASASERIEIDEDEVPYL